MYLPLFLHINTVLLFPSHISVFTSFLHITIFLRISEMLSFFSFLSLSFYFTSRVFFFLILLYPGTLHPHSTILSNSNPLTCSLKRSLMRFKNPVLSLLSLLSYLNLRGVFILLSTYLSLMNL